MKRAQLYWTVIFIAVFFVSRGQQITGKVVSEEDEPISSVRVFMDSLEVTTTDANGEFSIAEGYSIPFLITLKHPNFETKTFQVMKVAAIYQMVRTGSAETLQPVVITTETTQQSGVLVPTTNIGEREIERFSPVDVVSAINQTPGIFIQNGAINTNRITVRGVGSRTLFGTNKIRAYFNGIPITNGVGETTLDSYNPEDLAQLEIVKGPKATRYGTNLGGTLLLRSKTLESDGATIANSTTIGSYGLVKNSTKVNTKEDKLSLHFNYDHLELDGFRDNSDYNRNTYLLTGAYAIADNHSIGILLNHTNDFAQIPSSLSRTNFEADPTQAAFTWDQARGFEDNRQTLAGLSYEGQFSDSFKNTTSVYYSYLDHYEPRPFNILDEFTHGYGARTVFTKVLGTRDKNVTLNLGTEVFQDEYNWKTMDNLYEENNGMGSTPGALLSDNKEVRSRVNVFASAMTTIAQNLDLQVGINVNNASYTYTDQFNTDSSNTSGDRNFDPILAPSVNALYRFYPTTTLYGNISRGFNYPSLEETLTPTGLINPDIGPETGWNFEVGSRFQFFDNSVQMEAAAYLLIVDDLVVAERVGNDQFIGRNAGETHHRGVELSVSHRLSISENLRLHSFVNSEFNFHKFIDFVDADEDFSGNDLTGVPDVKFSAGFRLSHTDGWYFLSNFQHIGQQPITDANTLYSEAYSVVTSKFGYAHRFSESLRISVNAGINNLFDERYASSILINASSFGGSEPRYFYPGAPRNYFGGISLQYTF